MILDLDTSNIKDGMIIKNYKELCKLLNINTTTGKSKQIQLREINRYIDLFKDNTKYVVLEVYDKPLPSNINSKYTTLIQAILLNYLSKQKEQTIYINKNELIKILGLVNNKYIEYRNNRKELIKLYNDLDEFNINEFYKRCDAKILSILESSFKSLKKRFLLDYSDAYRIYYYDEHHQLKNYIASNEEHSYILSVKRKILEDMNLKSEYQIYINPRIKNEFYDRVNLYVKDERNWEYIFQCYKIICNPVQITEVLTDERYLLNGEVKKAIDSQANRNYKKYNLPNNYILLQSVLSDMLIELTKGSCIE